MAQLRLTAAFAIKPRTDTVGTAYIWEDGNCASKQYLGKEKQLTIPAGRAIVIRREWNNTLFLGPMTFSSSCGIPLRFVPVPGETYESRFTQTTQSCSATILGVGPQGRTQLLKDVSKAELDC
jgi:hypothetical protein